MTYDTIEKYRVLIAFETNYDAVFTVEIFSFRRFYHILVAVRRRLNELHFLNQQLFRHHCFRQNCSAAGVSSIIPQKTIFGPGSADVNFDKNNDKCRSVHVDIMVHYTLHKNIFARGPPASITPKSICMFNCDTVCLLSFVAIGSRLWKVHQKRDLPYVNTRQRFNTRRRLQL